ncbi:MAG: right-handed parallel beta-helix repeat-containing protein [Thiomargarita sp.]|nr:right-handed parallel beta-helix repeat-containing protein [Thiomargarita sp.]
MSKKKLLYLLFITGLGLTPTVQSATYYISSSTGNDANDGTSESSPWQTIDKVNEVTFEENASILFKRGDLFRGGIKPKGVNKELSFSAYGTGELPVIAGSVEIGDWQLTTHPKLDKTKVWEAQVSHLPLTDSGIQNLFVNGEVMTIARYPNVASPKDHNWLEVDKGIATGVFVDSALADYSKPDGYWKGARLRIRTYSWMSRVFEVTGYNASTGKITAKGLGKQVPEWGYFLDGILEELDSQNEWYYDEVSQTVYLYSKANPNKLLVEGSTYGTGMKGGMKLVENLTFRHFSTGVSTGGLNRTIRQCRFEYNRVGISIWQGVNLLVKDNTFKNIFSTGISYNAPTGFDIQDSVIENNRMTDIGTSPIYCGHNFNAVCYGMGIQVQGGKGHIIRQNTIERTGWNGMYLGGEGYHIIENNVVRHALMVLNDGGAISLKSANNTIRGNFLLESIGNVDESNGCSFAPGADYPNTPCGHHHSYGMGLGSDVSGPNNVIEGNTIANNPHRGIRSNHYNNALIRNNVLYNNNANQIVMENKNGGSRNNVIEGNIVYSLTPSQIGINLKTDTKQGQLNNNYYCNPYNEVVINRGTSGSFSLAHFQNDFSPQDKNSKQCSIQLKEYTVSQVVGDNLVNNSYFDTDKSGWKGKISHEPEHPQMDGGSLKAEYSSTVRLVMQDGLNFTQNQFYRLTFRAIAEDFITVKLSIIDHDPDNTQTIVSRSLALNATPKEFEVVFHSPMTTDKGRFMLGRSKADTSNYWIDNVVIEPVDATWNDPKKQSVLFTNTSAEPKTISLQGVTYLDLDGNTVTGSLTLEPFTSQILIYASGDTPPPPPPPADKLNAPTLSVEVDVNIVTLSWTSVTGAEGYRLYYAPYPNPDPIADIDMSNKTSVSFELPMGSAFYVAIKAYNKQGKSDYSNIEHFIIPIEEEIEFYTF